MPLVDQIVNRKQKIEKKGRVGVGVGRVKLNE